MIDKRVIDIITRKALGPDDPRLKRRKAEVFAFPVVEKEKEVCKICGAPYEEGDCRNEICPASVMNRDT